MGDSIMQTVLDRCKEQLHDALIDGLDGYETTIALILEREFELVAASADIAPDRNTFTKWLIEHRHDPLSQIQRHLCELK